jgi:hypothetical protein
VLLVYNNRLEGYFSIHILFTFSIEIEQLATPILCTKLLMHESLCIAV